MEKTKMVETPTDYETKKIFICGRIILVPVHSCAGYGRVCNRHCIGCD